MPAGEKKNDGDSAPVPAIKRSDDGSLIQYGYEHDGAFHPFAAERSGDYDERVQAAQKDD